MKKCTRLLYPLLLRVLVLLFFFLLSSNVGEPNCGIFTAVVDMLSMPENLAKVGNYRMNIMQSALLLKHSSRLLFRPIWKKQGLGLNCWITLTNSFTSVRNKYALLHLLARSLYLFCILTVST